MLYIFKLYLCLHIVLMITAKINITDKNFCHLLIDINLKLPLIMIMQN